MAHALAPVRGRGAIAELASPHPLLLPLTVVLNIKRPKAQFPRLFGWSASVIDGVEGAYAVATLFSVAAN